MESAAENSFVERVCQPFLKNSQNQDGGWSFRPGSQSRVEPTCWALQALRFVATSLPPVNSEFNPESNSENVSRGLRFLRSAQLGDGSWPSTADETTGSWVTSLACCVLRSDADAAKAVAAGLKWLCEDWPRDSSPWRRFLGRFSAERDVFPINNSYRGWGWTPRTSSWVEPTSFALLALERPVAGASEVAGLAASTVERRRRLATSLLYDRMCPGGGWNCGNPKVYGVAGEPLVVPTAVALLALRAFPNRSENVASLEWLERSVPGIRSAGSLALARMCLSAYGREWPEAAPAFSELHARGEFLDNVQVVAWTCLALNRSDWLAPQREVSP
jgi:Prenyltransferase and squalene oxidase repeat